jgi:hypothetical protein
MSAKICQKFLYCDLTLADLKRQKRESKSSKVKDALEGIQQLRGPNFTNF